MILPQGILQQTPGRRGSEQQVSWLHQYRVASVALLSVYLSVIALASSQKANGPKLHLWSTKEALVALSVS